MQDFSAERWFLELAGNQVPLGAQKTTTTPHLVSLNGMYVQIRMKQ